MSESRVLHWPLKPYRPSNGTEGMMFREEWCNRCEHERLYREYEIRGYRGPRPESCSILDATLFLATDDPEYPKEWVYDPEAMKRDGCLTIGEGGARCTAFVPERK